MPKAEAGGYVILCDGWAIGSARQCTSMPRLFPLAGPGCIPTACPWLAWSLTVVYLAHREIYQSRCLADVFSLVRLGWDIVMPVEKCSECLAGEQSVEQTSCWCSEGMSLLIITSGLFMLVQISPHIDPMIGGKPTFKKCWTGSNLLLERCTNTTTRVTPWNQFIQARRWIMGYWRATQVSRNLGYVEICRVPVNGESCVMCRRSVDFVVKKNFKWPTSRSWFFLLSRKVIGWWPPAP